MLILQDVVEDMPPYKLIDLYDQTSKRIATHRASDAELIKWYLCDVLAVVGSIYGADVYINVFIPKKQRK